MLSLNEFPIRNVNTMRIILPLVILLVPGVAMAAESFQDKLDGANSLVTWGLIIAGLLIVGSIVFSIIRHSIKLLFSIFLLAVIVGGGLVWYGYSQGVDLADEYNVEYELGPFMTVKVPSLESLDLPDVPDVNLPDVNLPDVEVNIGD